MIARKLKSFLVLAAGLAALAPAAAQQPQQAGRDPSEIVVLSPNQPGVRKATALVNGAVVTDTDVEQRLNLVVAANGGRVTAGNAPGGGAVFDLWLPARGYADTAPMTLG